MTTDKQSDVRSTRRPARGPRPAALSVRLVWLAVVPLGLLACTSNAPDTKQPAPEAGSSAPAAGEPELVPAPRFAGGRRP